MACVRNRWKNGFIGFIHIVLLRVSGYNVFISRLEQFPTTSAHCSQFRRISCNMNQKSSINIKPELCKACGLCIEFCPKNALMKGKAISSMGYEFTVYLGDGCIGCGTCFYVCPEPDTITVIRRKSSHNND